MITSLLNKTNEGKSDWNGEWKVVSPANLDRILDTVSFRYSDIELAIEGALEQREKLASLGFSKRKEALKRAIKALHSNRDTLLNTLALELGRTALDRDMEWSQISRFLTSVEQELTLDGEQRTPRGISAVVGSYVWPLFFSIHFSFLNFVAGNPVILKPSEKSTLTVRTLFEILRSQVPEMEAVQVLAGDREVGRRLVCHEKIALVIFQGSFEVGMRVKQDTLSQPSKEVLLYLGAKNPAVIFKDAPAATQSTLLHDAFLGAGQDCKSASLFFIQRSILDKFQDEFHERSKQFTIGSDPHAFMGPLIDGAMLDRYLKFIGISEREGAQILMRGKILNLPEKGHWVTPTLALMNSVTPDQMKKSVSLQTEILSPHVTLIGFDDEKDLLPVLQAMNHGRNASLWTSDSDRATKLAGMMDFGSIRINGSMLDSDPWKSFHVRKRSGNHSMIGRDLYSQITLKKSVE